MMIVIMMMRRKRRDMMMLLTIFIMRVSLSRAPDPFPTKCSLRLTKS
jgi:hypothetical protein